MPKPPRLRFSLRTLFVVFALVAAGFGWIAKERRQSTREIEFTRELRRQGWSVATGGPFAHVDRKPARLGGRFLETTYNVSDDTRLQRTANRFLGDRIVVLMLPMYEPKLHDLAPFASLTNLQTLYVNRQPIQDIRPLAQLTTLRWLDLGDTQISDITSLSGLTNLEVLALDKTAVRDLSPLTGMKKLHTLGLDDTKVSDLSHLKGLTELRGVFLINTPVSDVTPLMSLKSLSYLMLGGTSVTKEQVEALRQVLPSCKIWPDPFPEAPVVSERRPESKKAE